MLAKWKKRLLVALAAVALAHVGVSAAHAAHPHKCKKMPNKVHGCSHGNGGGLRAQIKSFVAGASLGRLQIFDDIPEECSCPWSCGLPTPFDLK